MSNNVELAIDVLNECLKTHGHTNGTRARVHAAIAALSSIKDQQAQPVEQRTAKQQYDEIMKDNVEPSAVERLRFFLSFALNKQDWLDVEKLIDDLSAPIAPQVPQGCMWAVTKGGTSICQPPRGGFKRSFDPIYGRIVDNVATPVDQQAHGAMPEPVYYSVTINGEHCTNIYRTKDAALSAKDRLEIKFPEFKRDVVPLYAAPQAPASKDVASEHIEKFKLEFHRLDSSLRSYDDAIKTGLQAALCTTETAQEQGRNDVIDKAIKAIGSAFVFTQDIQLDPNHPKNVRIDTIEKCKDVLAKLKEQSNGK